MSVKGGGAPAPPCSLELVSSPPGDEHLLPRIELDTIGPMHMEVAVERPFPSREGEKGEGLCHRDVYAHHPRLDAIAKLTGRPAVTCENDRHIAECHVVRLRDRLL